MLLPSVFTDNFLNDFMSFPMEREFFTRRSPLYGKREGNLMKTDIKEIDSAYEVAIELPGYKKDEISAKLENGYLTISASKSTEKEEKDEKSGTYIRRERYSGQCSRSFYVGDAVNEDDIKARFEDGILKLSIVKKEAEQIEEKKYIAIEG